MSGRYVMVHLEDSQKATVEQLIIDQGHQYLKVLNPNWSNWFIEVNSNATTGEVVVLKGDLV